MRVSIDCRYIRERPSGVGTYQEALVSRIPQLAPAHAFHLWAHPRSGLLSHAPNATQTVVTAPANGIRTLVTPSRLAPLREVDVFHATFNTLGRGIRCRTVVTIHDLMWLLRPEWCSSSRWRPLKQLYYRDGIIRALRQANVLIAISETTAKQIRARVDDPRRVRVIHHGVAKTFAPDPHDQTVETVRGLGISGPYFMMVGQNAPYKRHQAVRDAFCSAQIPNDMKLVAVQRLHAEPGHADPRIVVLPQVTSAELVALYQHTHALIQFSEWEGFGLPALEAMASGAPVIASAIPTLDEVLGPAARSVGDTTALRHAIEQLSKERHLRADLRGRGIAHAKRFSWDVCAQAHLAAYHAANRR